MDLVVDLDYTTLRPAEDYHDWRWFDEDPWTWLDFPPYPHAIEVLQGLHDLGHLITFCTARPVHPVNYEWCKRHTTWEWRIVEATTSKWDVPADLYLDDSENVLTGLWKRGLCAVKMDNGYNEEAPCAYKVSNWLEFGALMLHDPDVRKKKHQRIDPRARKRAMDGDRWAAE